MLIKNKDSSDQSNQLKTADLVCYEQDGLPILGLIEDFRKAKFIVLDMRGREIDLVADRLHRIPLTIKSNLATKSSKIEWLLSLDEKAKKAAAEIKLDELWSLVSEERENLSNARLCELYLGDNSTEKHLAMRYALLHDKVFFKRRQDVFTPRPAEQVEQLNKAEEARKRKTTCYEALLNCFKARLNNNNAPLPQGSEEILCLLEDIAADAAHLDNTRKRDGKELLLKTCERLGLELSGSIPEKAYTLLSKVSHFGPNTNLAFFRFRVPMHFSETVLAEAAKLEPSKYEKITVWGAAIKRLDLRALDAIAIDDESTKDMDDALTLETTAKGFRLGIHISDVACVIDPNSTLEREARRRATSIYCPDRTINMLPEALSEDKLSLLPDAERLCLSVFCDFDRTFSLKKSEILHTVIKVKKRLDYNRADAILDAQSDPDLAKIYEIASHLEAQRFERGGFRVNKGDVSISVKADGEFTLNELDESTPARALVGEMMVLANSIFSDFAVEHKLPLIFRGQDQPDGGFAPSNTKIPSGPAEDYYLRSQLKKSFISTKAAPHATLGLKAYAQLTSPIRRYLDICNQRQISEFLLSGKAFYSASELKELALEVEHSLKTALTLSRESKRFWLLRHIQRLANSKTRMQGTIVRVDQQSPLVEISDIYMNAFVKGTRKFNLGENIDLKVSAVDPRYGFLRLEEA